MTKLVTLVTCASLLTGCAAIGPQDNFVKDALGYYRPSVCTDKDMMQSASESMTIATWSQDYMNNYITDRNGVDSLGRKIVSRNVRALWVGNRHIAIVADIPSVLRDQYIDHEICHQLMFELTGDATFHD